MQEFGALFDPSCATWEHRASYSNSSRRSDKSQPALPATRCKGHAYMSGGIAMHMRFREPDGFALHHFASSLQAVSRADCVVVTITH